MLNTKVLSAIFIVHYNHDDEHDKQLSQLTWVIGLKTNS